MLMMMTMMMTFINDDSGSYLRDDGEFGAQVVKSDFFNHLVVNDDGSGCSLNDAKQSQRHG